MQDPNSGSSENLHRLKELTPTLPALITGYGKSAVHYSDDASFSVVGECLFNDGNVAVQVVRMSPGSAMALHHHRTEKEWILVIRGKLFLQMGGKIHAVNESEMICIPPGIEHSASVEEYSELLCITQPAAEGYP